MKQRREGHRERGRGAKDEGATRAGKGGRGGGREVSRREAESREKGLSVGGERRPNRSGEGGWLEGGAGRRPGGFSTGTLTAAAGGQRMSRGGAVARLGAGDPRALGAPGTSPGSSRCCLPRGQRAPLQLHEPSQPQGSPGPCSTVSLG